MSVIPGIRERTGKAEGDKRGCKRWRVRRSTVRALEPLRQRKAGCGGIAGPKELNWRLRGGAASEELMGLSNI